MHIVISSGGQDWTHRGDVERHQKSLLYRIHIFFCLRLYPISSDYQIMAMNQNKSETYFFLTTSAEKYLLSPAHKIIFWKIWRAVES